MQLLKQFSLLADDEDDDKNDSTIFASDMNSTKTCSHNESNLTVIRVGDK